MKEFVNSFNCCSMSDQELLYYSKHMLYITKGDTCSIGIVITCPQEYYRNYCTRLEGVVCGPCAIIAIFYNYIIIIEY